MSNMDMIARIQGIYVEKDKCLRFLHCNEGFLHITGLSAEDQALGLTDKDVIWQPYNHIYEKHDLDALEGKIYSNIIPVIDWRGKNLVFINTKIQNINSEGKVVGVISHAIEVINQNLLEVTQLLIKSDISGQTHYYSIGKENNKFLLTNRESECLFYLIRGKSAKSIAKILNISFRTVEVYLENLKIKFNCKTKSDLIEQAIQNGYVNIVPKSVISKQLAETLKSKES